MIKNRRKAITYNPEDFICSNLSKFVSSDCEVLQDISFSGFLKKMFNTGNRPIGYITIKYKDSDKNIKEKFFLKMLQNAPTAFNTISNLYKEAKNADIEEQIPKPIACDFDKNAIFLSCVEGIPLNQYIIRQLFFNRTANISNIFDLLSEIGIWLSKFHKLTKVKPELIDLIYISQTKSAVKQSYEFDEIEKEIIIKRLDTHKKYLENNKTLSLARTHNDFNLRNVLISANNNYYVIDWDAMIHPAFHDLSPIWIDITKFCISLKSLTRFWPYITNKNVSDFIESFLSGYFKEKSLQNGLQYKYMLWYYTLLFYIGMIGNRSLAEIYKKKSGKKFVSRIKQSLLAGPDNIY